MLRLFLGTVFELKSPLLPKEAIERLRMHVEPWNAFRLTAHRRFEGDVGAREFRIRRAGDFQTFALPFLIGTPSFAVDGGSSIHVHAKTPGVLQVGAAAWLMAVAVWLISGPLNPIAAALGTALAYVGYSIPSSLVRAEIDAARASLAEIFSA